MDELKIKKSTDWKIVISIVSHGQIELVKKLIGDLEKQKFHEFLVIIRENLNQDVERIETALPNIFSKNLQVCGFSENHNKNFEICQSEFFIIMNPDIRIHDKLFLNKIYSTVKKNNYMIAGPKVLDVTGKTEETARKFPTIFSLSKKLIFSKSTQQYSVSSKQNRQVDWLAGMLVCVKSEVYKELSGLNEKYFLYYEDVDFGWRAKREGYASMYIPSLIVEHDARRSSHVIWSYKKMHLKSIARFLFATSIRKLKQDAAHNSFPNSH